MTAESGPGDDGLLLVLRTPHGAGPLHEEPEGASPDPAATTRERFIAMDAQGRITAYNGHVDLGTGIRTALAQIVAEELDVPVDRVLMVLGHTGLVPNQGATIASETIQVTAVPLRQAAARARAYLVQEAATLWGLQPSRLTIDDGVIRAPAPDNRFYPFGELVAGRRIVLGFDAQQSVKNPKTYRVVGRPVPRSDIPAKATGTFTYVHDVRVPGMLHGRVVRARPYAGLDIGGACRDEPRFGRRGLGRRRSGPRRRGGDRRFRRRRLRPRGGRGQGRGAAPRGLDTIAAHPGPQCAGARHQGPTRRGRGCCSTAATSMPPSRPPAERMARTYVWPYQMHGSIGPSCAVADVGPDGATIWSGTQNPLMLRADLALLLARPEAGIAVVRYEAAGCYGRNCADDVSADAALLSRAGRSSGAGAAQPRAGASLGAQGRRPGHGRRRRARCARPAGGLRIRDAIPLERRPDARPCC